MQPTRRASLRILDLAILGCVLLPVLLLASGALTIRRAAHDEADQRLGRTADVLHEQALKVFQSTDVLLETLAEQARGQTDDMIRADFNLWHDRLKAMSARLPQLQSIWIVGADGRVCATDYTPTLPDITVADRDYFLAQRDADAGLWVGAVRQPLFGKALPFFSLSRRRQGPDSGFDGIIVASVLPTDFEKFYREIGTTPGSYLGLIRRDGAILARDPPLPPGAPQPSHLPILDRIDGPADRGLTTLVSLVDGRERRMAWRRLDPFPVLVLAGTETSAIHMEWLSGLASHLVFGVPATLLMLGALWVARIRTLALFDEADRRADAEDALQRARRLEALGELTGGVAHDFNNLLMIVLGNVDRMRRRPRDAADIRALDMIVTAVRRGEALTRQLLTFARRRALFPEAIDLATYLPEMRGLLTHSLRGDITISIDAGGAVEAATAEAMDAGAVLAKPGRHGAIEGAAPGPGMPAAGKRPRRTAAGSSGTGPPASGLVVTAASGTGPTSTGPTSTGPTAIGASAIGASGAGASATSASGTGTAATGAGSAAAGTDTFVIKVDPSEFELAVLNVTVNARDAMPRGGHLALRLRRLTVTSQHDLDGLRGEFVALSLSDTGTGIAPDLLSRVFDPFFTTKEIGKGTGLGLSQVYGFARQSGGTATVESTPGLGTTVTIYLPVSSETPARQEARPAANTPIGAGLRALLVEDNAEIAALTRTRLELLGFDVALASSGRSALSLLEAHSYALVVTDVLMPGGMSGIELVRELRAIGLQVPVVVITGYGGAAEQARREGLTVLPKPCDESSLREAIGAVLCGPRSVAPVPDQVTERL